MITLLRRLAALLALIAAIACTPEKEPDPEPGTEVPVETDACPENLALFREQAWVPVLRTRCFYCHGPGGQASVTRLALVDESTPDYLAKNLATFASVARLSVDGTSLVLLKPTGRHPGGHLGGTVVAPDSDEARQLARVAEWVRGETPSCADPTGSCESSAGPRLLRRLTHAQYRATVRDLLGVDASDLAFASDVDVHGFQNDAAALVVSPLLAEQYRAAAETLAERAVQSRLNELLPCASTQTPACADGFVRSFGRRAFRRPLSAEEIVRYRKLWRDATLEEGFVAGIRWTIAAMLQSPHFLYRAELGTRAGDDTFTLTAYERATELSYLLWQTMPDDELFAKAADGTLLTREVLAAQVDRMVSDPRASETMGHFFEDWLGLGRLETVPRDATLYPELTPAVRTAMRGEFSRFVADLVTSGAKLEDALESTHSYMTTELAAFYGVGPGTGDADAEGFRRVELAGTSRGGLLGLGAVLLTHALPTSSSPIHRGKLVRERLLCQPLPPPPPGIMASPPPMDPAKSTRERYAAHASVTACAACHSLIDPIGFAFEHFDATGRYRLKDGTHDVDASGHVVASVASDGTFSGLDGLQRHLAASPDVRACYARTFARWATGTDDSPLACALRHALPDGSPVAAVRNALVATEHFTRRLAEGGERDAPGTEPFVEPPPVEPYPPEFTTTLTLTETGRWGTGACFDATVTNQGAETVTWRVSAELEGAIDNIWNAEATVDGAKTWFTGVSWNKDLAPGASASFGFCESF